MKQFISTSFKNYVTNRLFDYKYIYIYIYIYISWERERERERGGGDLALQNLQGLKSHIIQTTNLKKDHIKTFVENGFSFKLAEFYLRGIRNLPDKWQDWMKKNEEYTIDWN